MAKNKAFEHLYGFYLYMHHYHITLQEIDDFVKEEWEKMGKDLEILEILKKAFPKVVLEHELGDAYECNRISEEEYNKVKEVLEDGK